MFAAITSDPQTLTDGQGLAALRTSAAFRRLSDTGWIAVTGEDRVRWMNGMVTNSVQALAAGGGAYSFLLNAQGRIQGDGTVWAEENQLLIETSLAQVEPMVALLDRFIIMDDVELADRSGSLHGIEIAGPEAAERLASMGIEVSAAPLRRQTTTWRGHTLTQITAYALQAPRYELWAESPEDAASLIAAFTGESIPEATEESFELLRILEGRPLFGQDIHDRDLPQETAQDRALHFSKGCYLGQEIVERIRSRGQVRRTFTRFVLHGSVPAAGTELFAGEARSGLLTSVAAERIEGEQFALGYVRRDALERGTPLTYAGGTATAWLASNQ